MFRRALLGCRTVVSGLMRTFKGPSAPTKPKVSVTFVTEDEAITLEGDEGDSLVEILVKNKLELEKFALCEGLLVCGTCHVILKQKDYDRMAAPTDDELDLVEHARGLTRTSRLGCQVRVTKEFDGLEVLVLTRIEKPDIASSEKADEPKDN